MHFILRQCACRLFLAHATQHTTTHQAMLLDLEDHIGKVDLGANPEEGKAFPGEFIYELFGRASLCFDSADMVSDTQAGPSSLCCGL
jgi:hypothetical protein